MFRVQEIFHSEKTPCYTSENSHG
ncbi:unnamed protein product [Staurois parvus]|uniref:Uncharacterized protein n=1 Tax=Staurois parvus TaxID=386267 RepID=A0ABN9BVR6_9NEOB|nr:unnamed protein product [Staurois parvus]